MVLSQLSVDGVSKTTGDNSFCCIAQCLRLCKFSVFIGVEPIDGVLVCQFLGLFSCNHRIQLRLQDGDLRCGVITTNFSQIVDLVIQCVGFS